MPDITYLFHELSRNRQEDLGLGPQPLSDPTEIDRLTAECLQIRKALEDLRSSLEKLRPLYLSATRASAYNDSMTDKQRDEFDYETRMIIQQQMGRLRMLEDLEKERIKKVGQHDSMISKLFVDPKRHGIEKTLQLHRVGMFWYLNHMLKSVSDTHASQQRIRLSRQLDKSHSTAIPEIIGSSKSRSMHPALFAESREAAQIPELAPQQVQELEQENSALLEELELTHDKVKQAEKSMYEVSELQTNLATHLASQTDMIHGLVEDSFKTTSNVGAANEQLASARKRNRRASKIIIYTSLVLALILLFYDFIL